MTYNPPPSGWSGEPQFPGSGQQYPGQDPAQYPGQAQHPGQAHYPGQPQPPGRPQPPGGPGGAPPGWQPEHKGFFGALFDFGFHHFVTPSIIKVLYVLGFVLISLVYLFYVIFAFTASVPLGVGVLLIGWIAPVLYLALWRVMLEFFLAVVRMSEDIHHWVGRGQ